MPIQRLPTFKPVSDKMLEIPQPAIGGLNLKELEYEQNNNQSPFMMNMMYRNGAFSKRYGQAVQTTYTNKIYSFIYFNGNIIVHSGTNIYRGNTQIASGMPEKTGMFVKYRQSLYYFCGNIWQYARNSYGSYVWGSVDPYTPEVYINCKPDGTSADIIDDYNIIGLEYKIIYNADGTSSDYYLYGEEIDTSVTPVVYVDGTQTTAFTFDTTNLKIGFTSPPPEGNLNVEVTLGLNASALADDRTRIFNSRFHETFGGNNNSRLFLAGGGDSKYFYSNAYDATYFPENNFAVLGNGEEDITGFGTQYNVLIAFKPNEMYSISSYTQTSSTTVIEEELGMEGFKSQVVNSRIGCDCPYSIQLVNNQLTWFSSTNGVCTLVSTNIVDERNVRPISRNINYRNIMGGIGILDLADDVDLIQSANYDNKYFLVFPSSGRCYVWDYEISPFSYSSSSVTDPRNLDWFPFDHFYVKQFEKVDKELFYISSLTGFENKIIKLNDTFDDLDFNQDGKNDAISAYYMTPLFQFNAVEYLKNVVNIYIQCRGDTATIIKIKYVTEENPEGEEELEDIVVGTKNQMWDNFAWYSFAWGSLALGNTFRRKCSLKKIQMAGFLFANAEVSRDLAISHISLQYKIAKLIK